MRDPMPTLLPSFYFTAKPSKRLPHSLAVARRALFIVKPTGGAAPCVDPGAHRRQPAAESIRLAVAEQLVARRRVEELGLALRHEECKQLGLEGARGVPARLAPARRRHARRARRPGRRLERWQVVVAADAVERRVEAGGALAVRSAQRGRHGVALDIGGLEGGLVVGSQLLLDQGGAVQLGRSEAGERRAGRHGLEQRADARRVVKALPRQARQVDALRRRRPRRRLRCRGIRGPRGGGGGGGGGREGGARRVYGARRRSPAEREGHGHPGAWRILLRHASFFGILLLRRYGEGRRHGARRDRHGARRHRGHERARRLVLRLGRFDLVNFVVVFVVIIVTFLLLLLLHHCLCIVELPRPRAGRFAAPPHPLHPLRPLHNGGLRQPAAARQRAGGLKLSAHDGRRLGPEGVAQGQRVLREQLPAGAGAHLDLGATAALTHRDHARRRRVELEVQHRVSRRRLPARGLLRRRGGRERPGLAAAVSAARQHEDTWLILVRRRRRRRAWREQVQAEEAERRRERRRITDDDTVERRPGVEVPHAQLLVDRTGDGHGHLQLVLWQALAK
eukprot:scaffold43634_cov64-Phaeocystis_antarctica.AAC.11